MRFIDGGDKLPLTQPRFLNIERPKRLTGVGSASLHAEDASALQLEIGDSRVEFGVGEDGDFQAILAILAESDLISD